MERRERIFAWGLAAVLAVGLALRVVAIETRPLHSDEGVNWYFLNVLQRDGYYPYSHENYHGPSFFYLAWLGRALVGDTALGLRVSTVVTSALLPLAALLLRPSLGRRGALAAGALLAVSPSLVFYGRYAIHETLLVAGELGLGLALFRWMEDGDAGFGYWAMVALAVMVTTKETVVIAGFWTLAALLAAYGPARVLEALRRDGRHLPPAALLAAVIVIFVYTSGLRWSGGLRELALGLPQWVGRSSSDTGHHKPWPYFLKIGATTEPQVLAAMALGLAAAGVGAARRVADDTPLGRFVVFATVWSAGQALAYSLIPYKTPWLWINVSAPALLLLAALGEVCARRAAFLGVALPVALTVAGVASTIFYDFSLPRCRPYGEGNPFSYVHTSPGLLAFVKDVQEYWRTRPTAEVLVTVDTYWPIPFYLRERGGQVGYRKSEDPAEDGKRYAVLSLDERAPSPGPGWTGRLYRFSDVQSSMVYFRD